MKKDVFSIHCLLLFRADISRTHPQKWAHGSETQLQTFVHEDKDTCSYLLTRDIKAGGPKNIRAKFPAF